MPFNETSFFCNWKLEPPEHMINLANVTGLTLTIKFTGSLGDYFQPRAPYSILETGFNRNIRPNFRIGVDNFRSIIRRNCEYPQYLELHGKIRLVNTDFLFFIFITLKMIIFQQYVEIRLYLHKQVKSLNIAGIGKLCGNSTETRFLRSPQIVNHLSVMIYLTVYVYTCV